MEEVEIRRGAEVVGPDGALGTIAHVVVDEATREITDLVLRRPDGHEWLVPANAVTYTRVPSTSPTRNAPARSGGTLQLREEELHVRKQAQEVGAVELRKDVVSEQRTIEVPVLREEVVLERHTLDPPRASDAPVGEARSVRVVLQEEVVSVDKQPVVTEVVRAGRRTLEETRHIEASVRREVADLETEGDVRVRQPDDL